LCQHGAFGLAGIAGFFDNDDNFPMASCPVFRDRRAIDGVVPADTAMLFHIELIKLEDLSQ